MDILAVSQGFLRVRLVSLGGSSDIVKGEEGRLARDARCATPRMKPCTKPCAKRAGGG